MRRGIVVGGLLAALLACTGTDTGNPFSGTDTGNPMIAGVLRDSSNAPVAACSLWLYQHSRQSALPAKVSLQSDTNKTLQVLVTNSDGRFEITGLSAGEYTLTAISHQKNLGIQNRLHIKQKDTILDALPGTMTSLQPAVPAIPNAWLGDTLTIRETGWRVAVDAPDFRLPVLAAGTYALQADKRPDSLVELSVLPFPAGQMQAVEWRDDETGLLKLPDGNVYALIRVGKLAWFAENSRIPIPGSTCHPAEPFLSCAAYGRFYTHSQAQSACPEGWTLPDSSHWSDLEKLEMTGNPGIALKADHSWHTSNGTNQSGFTALPLGTAGQPETGYHAYFWVRSPGTAPSAYHLSDTSEFSDFSEQSTGAGINVRCVSDM